MLKLFIALLAVIFLMAGESASYAGQLIPRASQENCDPENPFRYVQRGQKLPLTFDYRHYGTNKNQRAYYLRQYEFQKPRTKNNIRLCLGYFKQFFKTGATLYEPISEYFEEPIFEEPAIEEDYGNRYSIPRALEVYYPNAAEPGDIIVETERFRLFYILSEESALEYRIAVGREGFAWSGTELVDHKLIDPPWYPTDRMKLEDPDLPNMIEGGSPENPFGARAIYLGNTQYRIHGTNRPESIGKAVSSGCIRMLNEDVIELYDKVKAGARVFVYAPESGQNESLY